MTQDATPAAGTHRLTGEPSAGGLLTPARLIMAVFFLHAAGIANVWPRMPDLQAKLGIGPGELSIAMLGLPVATVLAVPFAGTLIAKLGPRSILSVALPLTTLSLALPGWAFDVVSLFLALFAIGLSYPVVDIAMNVEADRIERAGGRRIMSTCHGCWSVGSVAGAGVATVFATQGVPTSWHLLAVAVALLPAAVLVPRALPAVAGQVAPGRVVFTLPSKSILGLCVFLAGMLMVEVAARNWGAVYVSDELKGATVYAGLTYGAFALAMAVGRFGGDRVVERFGPVPVARASSLLAFAGLTLVVLRILAKGALQVLGDADIVDDQPRGLVAKDSVHPGDGLHQPVAPHRLVDVHRVHGGTVEAGQPHVPHDHQLQGVLRILRPLGQQVAPGLSPNMRLPGFRVRG